MTYDATIARLPLQTLFDLKGSAAALREWSGDALPPWPSGPLTYATSEERILAHIGPDHWLLRAPLAQEASLMATLRPSEAPEDVSVTRVSDTMAFFRIEGQEAAEILAIASPLDIHTNVFPANAVTYTEAFGLKALVQRTADGFDLAVERSYGPMIAEYLAKAIGQSHD